MVVNARREPARAKHVPNTKHGLECGPPLEEVISRIKLACAVTRKKLADLGRVSTVSEER